MNIYSSIRKAGILTKSFGYMLWSVKEVLKGLKFLKKKTSEIVNGSRKYNVEIQIINKNTGEYTIFEGCKCVTLQEAALIADAVKPLGDGINVVITS